MAIDFSRERERAVPVGEEEFLVVKRFGRDRLVMEVTDDYVWDRNGLEAFSHERSKWWGNSAMIVVKEIDKSSKVKDSFENLGKVIPVPQEILATQ